MRLARSSVVLLRDLHDGRLRRLPDDAPRGFIRPSWRRRIEDGLPDRLLYALCVFVELRDRFRAGDVWIKGSRRYRAVEEQFIPRDLFAAMQVAGPLPIAVPADARTWLDERRELLDRRLAKVGRKADLGALEDVVLSDGRMRISPLQAVTPNEAEAAQSPLYACLRSVRITDLLAEVDRWTGFTEAFAHLHTGQPADDPRTILTAALADATNLGLRLMADACSLARASDAQWHA